MYFAALAEPGEAEAATAATATTATRVTHHLRRCFIECPLSI